jgi:hypothetical protein
MRYTKRKTNVRQHGRATKHSQTTVRNHSRTVKGRAVLGTIALNDLNYKRAKKVFPKLSPRGDIDGDGVINKRDCHPFDVERQDDDEDWVRERQQLAEEQEEIRFKHEQLRNELRIKEEQEELVKQAAREVEERRIRDELEEANENLSNAAARQAQRGRGWWS